MKVLFVHTRYLQFGGEDNVVDAEIALLRSHGLEVDTLVFRNPDGRIAQFFNLIIESFNFISFFRVLSVIRRNKPDVIHVHNWHYVLSPSVFWAAKIAKVDVFCTIHNYRLLCPSASLFSNGKLFLNAVNQNFPWSAVQNKVYQNSFFATFFLSFALFFNQLINTWVIPKKIIFLNSFMAELFGNSKLKLRSDQIFIKPNFVDLPDLDCKLVPERKGFLFVGRLTEEKGIKLILDVFSKSDKSITIIGDGPLKYMVQDLASDHENIKYLGFLNKRDIIFHMANAEVLIFPSVWYEGMPITILEAFSCGTPVIASEIGSLKSIIKSGENGFFFLPDSANSLEKAISDWEKMVVADKMLIFDTTFKIFLEEYTPQKNFEIFRNLYNFK